jgi:tRNA uridine 5-carbamoylmethylation protein Kti12
MAGGPGSGKSYVASELFSMPKSDIQTTSYATGLKLINSDIAFEKGLRSADYEISKLSDYSKDDETWAKIMKIRDRANATTVKRALGFVEGRLGQIVDSTGRDYDKIKSQRKIYRDLGYDTYMIFVNTTLDVALKRNRTRARKLSDELVRTMWEDVQKNLGKFQNLFGQDNMIIIDNSADNKSGDDKGNKNNKILQQVERGIKKKLKTPVQNPIGKEWIKQNTSSRQPK